MMTSQKTSVVPGTEQKITGEALKSRQRRRSIWMALAIVGFVAFSFIYTITIVGPDLFLRAL